MYRTGVRQKLTARHALRGDFGAESVPHSHPYVVEWIIESDKLDENGFATDISQMESVLEEVIGTIDDVLLNDLDYFRDRQPSLENLASYLHAQLRDRMKGRVRTKRKMEILIWESDTAWASYVA